MPTQKTKAKSAPDSLSFEFGRVCLYYSILPFYEIAHMSEKDPAASSHTYLNHDSYHAEGAASPPIYQTSLFTFGSYEEMEVRFKGQSDRALYSRIDNPTVTALLQKLCLLEGGEKALAFSSGIAAISNAVLGLIRTGDHIVCVNHCYPDTYRLLQLVCTRFGVTTEFVNGSDTAAVAKALPGARILYLESPTSWLFQEQDLRALAQLAQTHGVVSLVDNSWASPIYQQPLAAGIDLVVHSATKYISGHSDVVAGALVGRADLINHLSAETAAYLGAKLSAHEASLLLRGLRTLPLRMERVHLSGLTLAKQLSDHSSVKHVNHPGLRVNPHSHLTGYGGLFSFEAGDALDIPRFCNALEFFKLGVSWGGHESLVMPAEISIGQAGSCSAAVDFGVSPRLIRLYVGLEDVSDLWEDLERALFAASPHG